MPPGFRNLPILSVEPNLPSLLPNTVIEALPCGWSNFVWDNNLLWCTFNSRHFYVNIPVYPGPNQIHDWGWDSYHLRRGWFQSICCLNYFFGDSKIIQSSLDLYGVCSEWFQYIANMNYTLQVSKTRQVLIIEPDLSFQGLCPYPLHHPYDTYSMVDRESLDTVQWPLSSQVRCKFCIFEPRDILFISS